MNSRDWYRRRDVYLLVEYNCETKRPRYPSRVKVFNNDSHHHAFKTPLFSCSPKTMALAIAYAYT